MISWKIDICLRKKNHPEHKYTVTFITKVGEITFITKMETINYFHLLVNSAKNVTR